MKEEELKVRIEKAWAQELGVDYKTLTTPILLLPQEKREGLGKINALFFGNHTVLLYDPQLQREVDKFQGPKKLAPEDIQILDKQFKGGRKTSIKYLNPSNFVPYDPVVNFTIRQLNQGDRKTFYNFRSHCSKEDLIEGYVELDHVAVFGAFYQTEIVAVSSIIQRGDIADIGIITMPEFRDLGLGKALGSKSSEWSIAHDKLVQYRHDVFNYGSLKVSRALGFKEYIIQQEFVYEV